MHLGAAALLAILILGAPSPAPHRRPPVFASGGYDAAAARATKARRLLVVDVASTACPPCRQMERTTWVDPVVERWFAEHAVAVQIVAEDDRPRARKLGVDAYPTLIALRDGREVDRVVGFQSASELLAWLDGVNAGKKKIDLIREKAGDRTAKKVDVLARLKFAQALLDTGELDEATDELVWLWQHMLAQDPASHGVRSSFLADDIERLVQRHPPARTAFQKLRDAAGRLPDRDDWIVLNGALGENAVTLKWFDTIRTDPSRRTDLERSDFRLRDMLIEAGRWADVAVLYPRPLDQLAHMLEKRKRMAAADEGPEFAAAEAAAFANELAELYAALLAATRDADAAALAARSFELNEAPRLREAFVKKALQARQPRQDHVKWGVDPELVRQVREALDKRGR